MMMTGLQAKKFNPGSTRADNASFQSKGTSVASLPTHPSSISLWWRSLESLEPLEQQNLFKSSPDLCLDPVSELWSQALWPRGLVFSRNPTR